MSAPNPIPGMFTEPPAERGLSGKTIGIALVAVAILIGVLVLMARRPAAPPASNDAYAAQIELSDIQMSEADSQTGGKLIYIDGRVTNHGSATVTDLRVRASFPNDLGQPAQAETVPLNLIYMREPYVDTRPVTAAPLAPGASADFRLIFDDVSDAWNQGQPALKLSLVQTK